jgi:hypothetical protein
MSTCTWAWAGATSANTNSATIKADMSDPPVAYFRV